jgi:hypothetical protein
LNDTVTDGNRPVWLSDKGAVFDSTLAMDKSGVLPVTVELFADV